MVFGILFWLAVIVALVYFIIRWAQGEAVINNQASGLSSFEREDDEEQEKPKPVPRVSGMPVSYEPQDGIHELAAQLREDAAADSTEESPVYLGDGSSVVPVHVK